VEQRDNPIKEFKGYGRPTCNPAKSAMRDSYIIINVICIYIYVKQ